MLRQHREAARVRVRSLMPCWYDRTDGDDVGEGLLGQRTCEPASWASYFLMLFSQLGLIQS